MRLLRFLIKGWNDLRIVTRREFLRDPYQFRPDRLLQKGLTRGDGIGTGGILFA